MIPTAPGRQDSLPLEEVVARANTWCASHHIQPASGQQSGTLTVRTARYYRALGLLDGPCGPPTAGYGRRHFLQLCAIRVLQSKGLALDRIQTLLFSRPDSDLEKILDSALSSPPTAPPEIGPFTGRSESWQVLPLAPDILLVLRNGTRLTPAQREGLQRLFASNPEQARR